VTGASSTADRSEFAAELFASAKRGGTAASVGFAVAIVAHVAFAATLAHRAPKRAEVTRPALDLEFVTPPAPPPKEHEPEPPPAEPAARTPVAAARPAPAAARAGALHTASAESPQAQAPDVVDFTTDPNGTSYGGGVVAVGGTADYGVKGATAQGTGSAPAPPKPAAGPALTALGDLSRRPALPRADPCGGYFPNQAFDDAGDVAVMIVVGKDGRVGSVSLVSEAPRGQGFFAAARSCLMNERLIPALDREGNPAATAIRVSLNFRR